MLLKEYRVCMPLTVEEVSSLASSRSLNSWEDSMRMWCLRIFSFIESELSLKE